MIKLVQILLTKDAKAAYLSNNFYFMILIGGEFNGQY